MDAYYVLFDNHEQAIRLHQQLDDAGVRNQISPTPRSVSVCCGVALLVREPEKEALYEFVNSHECVYKSIEKVELDLHVGKDRYC